MSIARKVDARAIHEIAMTWRLGEAMERVNLEEKSLTWVGTA